MSARRSHPSARPGLALLCALAALLPPSARAADLDGDGVDDPVSIESDGGTGWRGALHCVTHGASRDEACREFASTSYASFSASRPGTGATGADNRARPLLPAPDCVAADPAAPAQGALWALAGPGGVPSPRSETATGPRWHDGPPVAQVPVCLDLAQARRFPNGLLWSASGEVPADQGWQVHYRPPQQLPDATLRVVLEGDGWRLWQAGHALALERGGRHAWLANFESFVPDDSFKVDRWPRIVGIEADQDGLRVEVAVHGGPPRSVRLAL